MANTEPGAFEDLVVTEYASLLRYANRLTSDQAEAADLVHSVIARILSQKARLQIPNNVASWLRTILFRIFVDQRRRAMREKVAAGSIWDQMAGEATTPLPSCDAAPRPFPVTGDEATAILSSLPAHYREPYELFTFQHLSYNEIADRLAVPPRTVGSRLNRARTRLRALLTGKRRHRH